MSDCKDCGAKSEHVRLVVPWDSKEPIVVVHRCNTRGCPSWGAWEEPVRDLFGAVESVSRHRRDGHAQALGIKEAGRDV